MQGPRYTGKRARREERLHETRLRQALADLTDCSVCLSTCVEPHALRACGHTFTRNLPGELAWPRENVPRLPRAGLNA